MITPFPSCMIGPSEPCEMFQAQTAEIDRLRAQNAAMSARIVDLTADHATHVRILQSDRARVLARAERAESALAEAKAALGTTDEIRHELDLAKAALSAANARVVELEVQFKTAIFEGNNLSHNLREAEARVGELEQYRARSQYLFDEEKALRQRADAERDALREALEQIESALTRGDKSVSYMLMKARTALATSPSAVPVIEEMRADKIARLQSEIASRQSELAYMVIGDPRVSVSAAVPVGREG